MKPAVGRVYVLSNKAMPGLLKIGYTMNTVEGRVKELSSATGVPSEFCIEYQIECRDAAGVEALVHESFKTSRHNNSREFFSISLADAVNEIRKHAREIIDEEITGPDGFRNDSGNSVVTLYLISVNKSKHIFRIGLVKKSQDFLKSEEFQLMMLDLYNSFDSNFFYGCEVIQANEFTHVDEDSIENMRNLLDGNIKRLKLLNMEILNTNGYRRAREYEQRINGKYDLRTLSFSEYKEAFPAMIYKSCLSLLEPIAKACFDKSTVTTKYLDTMESANQEKINRLDIIKKMGI